MMGLQSADQRRFFYDFCLEDHVPADHLLKQIDGLFDLGLVRRRRRRHAGRECRGPEQAAQNCIVIRVPSSRKKKLSAPVENDPNNPICCAKSCAAY